MMCGQRRPAFTLRVTSRSTFRRFSGALGVVPTTLVLARPAGSFSPSRPELELFKLVPKRFLRDEFARDLVAEAVQAGQRYERRMGDWIECSGDDGIVLVLRLWINAGQRPGASRIRLSLMRGASLSDVLRSKVKRRPATFCFVHGLENEPIAMIGWPRSSSELISVPMRRRGVISFRCRASATESAAFRTGSEVCQL